MALKRIVTYFNIAVGVALLLAGSAVYWYGWRALPQTSGTMKAPVASAAKIERDALGIPNITAASVEDAVFLQGFTTAQDRLWQMEALRRFSAGRLAEIIGPSALPLDREARQLRLERAAEDHCRTVTAADRALLAAYTRGVNHFIETHRGRLPVEFTLLRFEPRPWRIVDTVLIAMHMYRDLTTTWSDEITKSTMASAGDAAKVNLLFPIRAGGEVQPGSNAWALSGSRTASGKPLLANDPHLEFSIPGIWYMVRLRAPGLDVGGVALPGVPGVVIGHNARIAWGVTNLQYDVQDLYIEKFDPATGRYVFRGQLEQARLERDSIPVKGAAPVEITQWVTRHGPIFTTNNNQFLALRWTAAEPDGFAFPIVDLNRARNWQEFTAALARYPGPAQNFVYADVDGNIGYHVAGRLPVRKTYDGDVPVDGASGEFEWQGYIPFEELPQAWNPPSGMIITANQNPFPPNYPYRVNGNFAAPYRASEIQALLSSRTGWKPADMIAVQKDVYSAFAHRLSRAVVAAWDRRGGDASLGEAVRILRDWNGQMEKGQAAPLIATLTYQHFRTALGERTAPGKQVHYRFQMAPAVVEALLRERPKDWFPDWDRALLDSFAEAMDEGRRIQGRNVSKWDWGRYNALLLAHPVGKEVPLVARYFNIGPAPMSGSTTSIKQTTNRMGPSMRMAADLADWDNTLMGIVTGESGQVLSKHYKDQWEAYYSGRGLPFRFRQMEVDSRLVVEPR